MNPSTAITGVLTFVGEIQTFGQNQTPKRMILIKTEGDYPELYQVELLKARVSLTDSFGVGELVTAQCNLQSREFQGKYYLNLHGWRLDKVV